MILWRYIHISEKYTFESDSDCEILLPTYQEYGTDMFSMLDEEFENRYGKHIHARPFTKESLLYREIFEKNGLTTCLFLRCQACQGNVRRRISWLQNEGNDLGWRKKEMKKCEQLYEGKAKKVFLTDDPDILIVSYKDDATAFNGLKKGTIVGKGAINNRMTNVLFQKMEEEGIPTHLIQELNDRETAVRRVEIVPLEVIVRNVAAGSFSKRLGVEEGTVLTEPTIEFSYKNDELGDPLINSYFAKALQLATASEIKTIENYAFKINKILKREYLKAGLRLIDFKIEFGRFHGKIILADEISPDTCRLWDVESGEKMDKDRFRRDLGNVGEAYIQVAKRLGLEME